MTNRPRPRLSLSLNGLSARQLAAETWKRMEGHDAMIWAAAIAFYALFATVPLLALFLRRLPGEALAAFRRQLQDAFPDRLEETLLAEQYYYVQLWKERYDAARDYALGMDERLRRAGLAATVWRERAADAAFYRRDLGEAGALYTAAIGAETDHGALMVLYLKLADVAHLTGDLETERMLREHYYGTLTE